MISQIKLHKQFNIRCSD